MEKPDKESLEFMKNDKEFYCHIIEDVIDDGDTWQLNFDRSAEINCVKIEGFIPQKGMTAKFFGKGRCWPVRGIVIDDTVMFYRTPQQAKEDHKKVVDNRNKKNREEFKKNIKHYDAQYNSLPNFFKARIDQLRNKNPDDRPEWEPYELMIATQAVEIAKYTKTIEDLQKWWKLENFKEQKKIVPTLWDGHSNYTFGCSCNLAIQHITDQNKANHES